MTQTLITQYDLTPREVQIVGMLLEGFANREIAKECLISEETVKRHLSSVFDKTGMGTRTELVSAIYTRRIEELEQQVRDLSIPHRNEDVARNIEQASALIAFQVARLKVGVIHA